MTPKTPDEITKDEIFQKLKNSSNRNLFLGNGFSISRFPKLFKYSSIFEQCNLSDEVIDLFDDLKTFDFEKVVGSIHNTMQVLESLGMQQEDDIARLCQYEEHIKDEFIRGLSNTHPQSSTSLRQSEKTRCNDVFKLFYPNGSIFTTNYDLMPYWVLLGCDAPYKGLCDGFRKSTDFNDSLLWSEDNDGPDQNLYFLHGALHLTPHRGAAKKLSYASSNSNLLRYIKSSIENDRFPLIVTDGSPNKKLEKIRRNSYLYNCYRELKSCSGDMLVFGYSFNWETDEHILTALSASNIENLYISLPDDIEARQNVKSNVAKLQGKANARNFKVSFYNSHELNFWN